MDNFTAAKIADCAVFISKWHPAATITVPIVATELWKTVGRGETLGRVARGTPQVRVLRSASSNASSPAFQGHRRWTLAYFALQPRSPSARFETQRMSKPGYPISRRILATSSVDLGIDFSEMRVMELAWDGGRDG